MAAASSDPAVTEQEALGRDLLRAPCPALGPWQLCFPHGCPEQQGWSHVGLLELLALPPLRAFSSSCRELTPSDLGSSGLVGLCPICKFHLNYICLSADGCRLHHAA